MGVRKSSCETPHQQAIPSCSIRERKESVNKVMGNLVAAIGGVLHDLGSWMSIIGLIIIPYGLIQENFIYPNQFLLRKVLILSLIHI